MEDKVVREIVSELVFYLDLARVVDPEITRREASGLDNDIGYNLTDLLEDLAVLDEDLANDWIEFDDVNLMGEYLFESRDPGLLGYEDLHLTSEEDWNE